MTRIAISSEGPRWDDRIDPRFGRAAGFVIVDPETLETEYVDNGGCQAMRQGAGIQAAESLSRRGVDVVLTGVVGPKALRALTAVGIKIGQGLEGLTVREVWEKYHHNQIVLV